MTRTIVPDGRVHEGVLDQHPPDLQDPPGVALRGHTRLGRSLQPVPGRGRPGAELRRELEGELGEIERLARHRQPARVEPRQIEEIRREPGQAGDLFAHLPDELVPRRLVELGIVEQLQEPGEREERRAQLVRGIGDELAARPLEIRRGAGASARTSAPAAPPRPSRDRPPAGRRRPSAIRSAAVSSRRILRVIRLAPA